MPKNSYTNKLVIFSILRHNLSKFVTQMGLYCSKQLETTFNQVGKTSLHIIFKSTRSEALWWLCCVMAGRWTIRGRVTQKSNIRTWSNSRGEGKLFNIVVVDESGEIRATAFNNEVDKFYALIEVNKVRSRHIFCVRSHGTHLSVCCRYSVITLETVYGVIWRGTLHHVSTLTCQNWLWSGKG